MDGTGGIINTVCVTDEQDDQERLPAPEHLLLTKLDEVQLSELIERMRLI